MYKVNYTRYRRQFTKAFDTYDEARKFFFGYCKRSPHVSRAEIVTPHV